MSEPLAASRAQEEAWLLACLHQAPSALDPATLPPPDSPRWDRLAWLAATQRVRPLVHRRLHALQDRHPMPAGFLATLDEAAKLATVRNLQFHAEAAAIARTLQPQGIDTLVLKGAHLASGVYDQIGLREMSDLDLLVRRDHLAAAVGVLEARGYRPLQPFSIDLDAALHHHLTKFVKHAVAGIELHWTISPPADQRGIAPEALWTRAQPLTLGGARLFALSNEDLLLHVCGHASYHHQFRVGLRPFCDVAAIAARSSPGLDWDVVVSRAREWQWERGVGLTLRLSADLVGAAVPPNVLAALVPAGLDGELLASARAQVFDDRSPEGLEPGVARLASHETLAARLRHLARRVVPPPREVARLYGQREGSPLVAFGYARRAWDLARRHAKPAIRLLVSRDSRLTDAAARTERLRRWLT